MTLEVIDDFARLHALRSEWAAFAESLPRLSPFGRPEWLIPWWRHFGSGTLRCFLFRNSQGALVGLLPCFLHPWNGVRQITLLGAGISDYLDPAVKPEYAAAIVTALRDYLDKSGDWDVCDWQDLSSDSPLRTLATTISNDAPCMQIPLAGDFATYWASCGKGLRQNVRRDRGKAEARGPLEFAATNEADPELLDGLISMHRARWERKDQSGMIEANRSAAFLRDVAHELASAGLLKVFSLRFDGALVAVIFGFANRGTVSNYLTGFDPAHERLGFGRTLLYEALAYSFENGFKIWDFLRGDEPYKSLWRAQVTPKIRIRVARTT